MGRILIGFGGGGENELTEYTTVAEINVRRMGR